MIGFEKRSIRNSTFHLQRRSHGVKVSTLDFEYKDPSSSLGGTYSFNVLYRVQLQTGKEDVNHDAGSNPEKQ